MIFKYQKLICRNFHGVTQFAGNGTSPAEFQIDPFLSDHTITK